MADVVRRQAACGIDGVDDGELGTSGRRRPWVAHEEIAWARLAALVEGARLASEELWAGGGSA